MNVPALLPMEWRPPQGVRAAFTTRVGGVSSPPCDSFNLAAHVGDAPADVATNRAALRMALGLPAEPVWLEQVHGADVLDLDLPAPERPVTSRRRGSGWSVMDGAPNGRARAIS